MMGGSKNMFVHIDFLNGNDIFLIKFYRSGVGLLFIILSGLAIYLQNDLNFSA